MPIRKILVVDNDPLFLEAASDLLHEKGLEVARAADGLEALEAVRQSRPDCILLDLVMPKIDGARVCRYLKQDPATRDIPVIIFSALSARDIIVSMPDLEAEAYVAKGPWRMVADNILAALERLDDPARAVAAEESIFGYEGFKPRRLVSELLIDKRHHECLLANLTEGVMETDVGLRIIYVNPAALALLGREERELIGSVLPAAFAPTHQAAVADAAQRLMGTDQAQIQLSLSGPGGRIDLLLGNILDGGRYAGLMAVLRPPAGPT